MVEQKIKILVVDDDPFVRAMLGDILESDGYLIETAKNGKDALEKYFEIQDISLIISDMNMPEMNGLEFIQELRKTDRQIPIIILTVNTEINIALEAIRSGASDYLLKDENIQDTILISVEKALEKHRLKKQNIQLMQNLLQKNKELQKKNKELIEVNKLKNKFLGIAAHDLRGPISGIIGLSGLLMDKAGIHMIGNQKEWLTMIQTISYDMLDLLNDLLDISVIESGKIDLKLQKVSITKLVEDRIRINRIVAGKKDIAIHTDIAELPDIMLDYNRILQVFENLMSNAIKFSPRDSVIHVVLNQENNMVKVSVRDEGPGISEDEQTRLFGEFQRLTPQPTNGEPSTGLGLAIVKKIIDVHNGILDVESQPGSGSTFSFRIPVE
ncbi:MAG: hybrid sensor histidine kinase/response regulator [Desulfobacterales bacterium]|nr:hybrid sensor histidine kinase/response regulator [Desulfobacterales bacterium]